MATRSLSTELLLDSEANLRIADGLLDDLRPADSGTRAPSEVDARTLPAVLLQAYQEVQAIMDSLRRCRSVLERTTVSSLHRTQLKLREVSNATEVAANDMLDGLDRALRLVDELHPDADASADRRDSHSALRNELHGLVSCLQFQDITSQQLGYASNVLEDIESRMAQVAELLDASAFDCQQTAVLAVAPVARPFDPAASTLNADIRQAVADEIFFTGGPGSGS